MVDNFDNLLKTIESYLSLDSVHPSSRSVAAGDGEAR